jgi:NADPH-dependent 2,4-dienoyl-CoA reductase/sulfur reductase-like enzyme
VVLGLGVVPATEWLEGSGVRLDDGVVCDSRCVAEGTKAVAAAGDVARWFHPTLGRHVRIEHFDNANAQPTAAARALLMQTEAPQYDPVPSFWSDQYDVKFQLLGMPEPDDAVQVVEGDARERRFVAAYGRDGTTVAVLAANQPVRLQAYRQIVANRAAFPPNPPPETPPG